MLRKKAERDSEVVLVLEGVVGGLAIRGLCM